MEAVRVVLFDPAGQARPGQRWAVDPEQKYVDQALPAVLEKIRSIDLVTVASKTELEEVLRREHFKVLVLPASAHNEADCQHYLAVRPDISILVIDIEVPEVIVRFRDAGSEMIARVIRSLSESSASRSEHRGRVHWLSSKDFDAPAAASNGSSEPYATAKEHL